MKPKQIKYNNNHDNKNRNISPLQNKILGFKISGWNVLFIFQLKWKLQLYKDKHIVNTFEIFLTGSCYHN